MGSPLDGPRLKLARADVHLRCLDDEIRDFLKSDTHRVIEKYESKTRRYAYEFIVVETPPEWGPLIGDIAHNLRSALDHLAWQLAIIGGSGPGGTNAHWPITDISWPIYSNANEYRFKRDKHGNRIRPWRRDGLLSVHARAVRKFQPYQRKQAAKSHPLSLLSRLSNIDKHRILHTVAVTFDPPDVPFHEQALARGTPVVGPPDAPAEIERQDTRASFRTGHIERDVQLKGNLSLDVEFAKGTEFGGKRVLRLLHKVRAGVKAVLDTFAPLV